MATRLFFCSSVSYLGTHLAQTLQKPSLLWMMSYAEPWLISKWFANSSVDTCRFSRIMAWASSTLLSVMDVDGRPALSSSLTLVRPCSNLSIQSYTLCRGKPLSPYWADSLRWISAPVTTSDHKKRVRPRCSSFVNTESGADILIVSQRKDKLCDDAETFHKRRQSCYLLACARRKQYRQPIKNYNTCADTYWLNLAYPFSNATSYCTFYGFFSSFRITLWPMWLANSKRQPCFHPPQSHAQEDTQNWQKNWQTLWKSCVVPESIQFSFSWSFLRS